MRDHKTVQKASEVETVVNRSRFIGRCFPVADEAEALAILARLRKREWDASHHCYAYRLGETGALARYSDDGEPGGTAGQPILNVLNARELCGALIVVTRYFGGILLGAGGLTRAYGGSAAAAVAAAGEVLLQRAALFRLRTDYSRYGTLSALCSERGQVQSTDFAEEVTIVAAVPLAQAESFAAAAIDKSDGRCHPEPAGETYLRIAL